MNTVSRALAGKDAVNEQTRELVRAEADRLGYVPNSMARSLVLGAAMTFGMVITHPANPFYSMLISGVEERCRANGYSLLLMVTEESLDIERSAAEALQRWGVDGAIVIPVQESAEHWQRLQDSGVPIVLVNRDLTEMECDFAGVDYEAGAYRAASHLLDSGARTIHLLEEDLPLTSVGDRITGFRRALDERGVTLADDTIRRVPSQNPGASTLPWELADAYHLAQELVPELAPGAAVMTGNDYFALGLYRALAESDLRVPDDVAILGFGDHPFSAYLNPTLSSVRLPAAEIGTAAVDMLLHRLKEMSSDVETLRLQPELVVRASTR